MTIFIIDHQPLPIHNLGKDKIKAIYKLNEEFAKIIKDNNINII